jgi:mannose-6-phosphate isomerase-like protein (cupin superfamily)
MSHRAGDVIDLSTTTLGLHSSGELRPVEDRPGPPARIDGLTIGAPLMTRAAPHGGEMHPDGDELLFVLSGRVEVLLEDVDPPRTVELGVGQALIVPRGVWHRVLLVEPSQLLHITPGPRGEYRPPISPAS